MARTELDSDYWSERYLSAQTGWDIGEANSGLVHQVLARTQPTDPILIPGAGAGHEAVALWMAGYFNVYVCDWSAQAFQQLRENFVRFGSDRDYPRDWELDDHLLLGDFFSLDVKFDVIVEQTFFCAIDPAQREQYVAQCARLLQPAGVWLGLLFDRKFPTAGPPFGGSRDEYRPLFEQYFNVEVWETFNDSIAPRAGQEILGLMRCK